MNKKAEAILLELLIEIIQCDPIYSERKANLLQKLIDEFKRGTK